MSSLNVNLLRHTGRPIFRRNPRIFPPAKSLFLVYFNTIQVNFFERKNHIYKIQLRPNYWQRGGKTTIYEWPQSGSLFGKCLIFLSRDLLALSYKHQNVSTVDTVETEEAFDPELAVVNDEWNQKTKVQRENYYLQFFSGKIMDSLTRREDYDRLEVDRIEKLRAKLLSVMARNFFSILNLIFDSPER